MDPQKDPSSPHQENEDLAALRRSEAKFRLLHETRIDAFVSVSMDGRIQEFNELFQQMVGYPADELRTLSYRDLTPEKWHAFEADIVDKQVLVRGHSELYQKEYRRKDGTVFPIELRTILIRDRTGGPPIGMWAVVRDISSRKQAEQALIESKEALADAQESLLALINSTSDLIWAVDPTTFGLTIFNEALRRLFASRGVEARVGMTPADLLPPQVAERWPPIYRRALRDGPFVERYVTVEGTPVLLLSLNLVKRAGTVTGISVFGKDVTAITASEAALRASEQRFRQVAETVSDFIWEVDVEGLYTYTSPTVEKILGYSPGELVGRKHFYDLFTEDVREELRRAAFEVFAAKEPFRGFPNANVSKDGRPVQLETSGTPLLDEAGNLLGYRGADSDVTERWLSERAMRDLTGRLINAQEAERARLGRELHDDFSQRLALIAINLDLLRQSPLPAPDQLRARMSGLSDDINALSSDVHRISHELHPARLEQLGLAAAGTGLCRELSATHRLSIQFSAGDVPRTVPFPVSLCLYRVTQEALQNVIKHSGATSAVVDLANRGETLHLMVSDDGHGFDAAAAERGGSLGLVSMRERVHSIGGRFAITSAPDKGTRIDVDAPLPTPLARPI